MSATVLLMLLFSILQEGSMETNIAHHGNSELLHFCSSHQSRVFSRLGVPSPLLHAFHIRIVFNYRHLLLLPPLHSLSNEVTIKLQQGPFLIDDTSFHASDQLQIKLLSVNNSAPTILIWIIWTLNFLRVQLIQDRQGSAMPDSWWMVMTSAIQMDTSLAQPLCPLGKGWKKP